MTQVKYQWTRPNNNLYWLAANFTTPTNPLARPRPHTFIPQGEPSHLGEVFEGLKADGSSGAQAGDAHLVLFDEARSRLTLFSRLFVYQTD